MVSKLQAALTFFSGATVNETTNETSSGILVWNCAVSAICSLGIVSTILTMCTVWKKLRSEKTSFFVLMFLSSGLDLAYNVTYIIFTWADTESLAFIICSGLPYAASLAADLCTLYLTAQRYFALKWPHLKMGNRGKLATRIAATIGIVIVSSTRIQYMFDESALAMYIPEWFVDYYNSSIYLYVDTFSNIVLPFILLVLMLIFSTGIILVVIRRHRASVAPTVQVVRRESAIPPVQTVERHAERRGSTMLVALNPNPVFDRSPRHSVVSTLSVVERIQLEQRKAKKEKAESAVSLVLFLDGLFILNQLGYCLYTLATISLLVYPDSPTVQGWESVSDIGSDMVECLSRSVNFFFYIKFSSMIRDEFKLFLATLKNCN